MPRILIVPFWFCLGATALTTLVAVFGPQEGLETLATGLLAYFTLLVHIPVGLGFLIYGIRAPILTLGYGVIAVYFICVLGTGLYYFVVVNDLDDAAMELVESATQPQNFRIRDLGMQLYRQYVTGQPLSDDDIAEWHQLALEADDLNRRDEQRAAPLWYAAAMGDTAMVTRLLESGAKTDDASLYWTTPLAAAVEGNHVATAKLLLEHGASPNAGENRDRLALVLATRHGNLELAALLLKAGADVDAGLPPAFTVALRAGQVEIATLLLDHGAQPAVYWENRHPIEVALGNRDQRMVDMLIQETDALNTATNSRDPVLFTALRTCDLTSFMSFLDLGASPDVMNLKGISILEETVRLSTRQCDLDKVRRDFLLALIDAGADLQRVNEKGLSPALVATYTGNAGEAVILAQHNASLAGEYSKKDFLMTAAQQGDLKLIDIALDRGFDPNRWTEGLNRSNALYAAAGGGHPEATALLIERGTRLPDDPNLRWQVFRMASRHEEVT